MSNTEKLIRDVLREKLGIPVDFQVKFCRPVRLDRLTIAIEIPAWGKTVYALLPKILPEFDLIQNMFWRCYDS